MTIEESNAPAAAPSLAAKLAAIAFECGYVQKDKRNDFHRYSYASAAAVLGKVNDALARHRVGSTVHPEVVGDVEVKTARGNAERLVTVRTTLTLHDGDSDATLTTSGLGSGQDVGDKAVMKAQTAAIKYTWLLALNISTGDDPEDDTRVDREMDGAAPGKPAATPKAPKPARPAAAPARGAAIGSAPTPHVAGGTTAPLSIVDTLQDTLNGKLPTGAGADATLPTGLVAECWVRLDMERKAGDLAHEAWTLALDYCPPGTTAAALKRAIAAAVDEAAPLDALTDALARCEVPADVVGVWRAQREAIAKLEKGVKQRAWDCCAERLTVLPVAPAANVGAAKTWLKRAVAEADAAPPDDDGPRGGKRPAANDAGGAADDPERDAIAGEGARENNQFARADATAAFAEYLATKTCAAAVYTAVAAHEGDAAYAALARDDVQALAFARVQALPVADGHPPVTDAHVRNGLTIARNNRAKRLAAKAAAPAKAKAA